MVQSRIASGFRKKFPFAFALKIENKIFVSEKIIKDENFKIL